MPSRQPSKSTAKSPAAKSFASKTPTAKATTVKTTTVKAGAAKVAGKSSEIKASRAVVSQNLAKSAPGKMAKGNGKIAAPAKPSVPTKPVVVAKPTPAKALPTAPAPKALAAGASKAKAAPATDAPNMPRAGRITPGPLALEPKTPPVRQKPLSPRGPMIASPVLPADYRPSEKEPYMNSMMLEYFRQKLLSWRHDLLQESSETLASIQEDGGMQEPDITDRATLETDRSLEFRTRDRERKLISKITAALQRIDDGEYGYCEETGDPIGVRRLEARPVATLSLEAQERHERMERTHAEE